MLNQGNQFPTTATQARRSKFAIGYNQYFAHFIVIKDPEKMYLP